MLSNTCPFANAIELPSLADAGFAALQSGELLAVEAIARVMKRRYSAAEAVFGDAQVERVRVGAEAIALIEDVFGEPNDAINYNLVKTGAETNASN